MKAFITAPFSDDSLNFLKNLGVDYVYSPWHKTRKTLNDKEIIEAINGYGAEIFVTELENVTDEVINKTDLKIIGICRNDPKRNVDVEAANKKGIPIIFTPDLEGTADFLITLDKRLSEERGQKAALIRYKPKMLTEDEWKLFIVESLPYVGPKTAERLLERFGTVRRIFNASAVELMSIPEIGEKKARRIVEILNSRFKSQRKLI